MSPGRRQSLPEPRKARGGEPSRKGLANLHSAPGHLIRRARQFHDALWVQEVGDALTPLQFAALTALDAEPGLNQRELGDRIALDKSTLGDLVARLDRHGYLKRRADPDDARSRVIVLTPAGRKVLATTRPAVVRIGDQILACLDESERDEFMRLLAKLVFSDVALAASGTTSAGRAAADGDRTTARTR
jgi:MarR family transcriptional regulator, temperature-dependent positive regulator of motility